MKQAKDLIVFTLSVAGLGASLVAYANSVFPSKERIVRLERMVEEIWRDRGLHKRANRVR